MGGAGVTVVAIALSLACGCSSSSSSGGTGGTGSSSGSTGSSSGGTGTEVLCKSGGKVLSCTVSEELSSAAASSAMSGCTAGGGTVVSACPSGIIGCCTIPSSGAGTVTQETCWYSGSTSVLQSACSSDLHGNWSTSQ
jgi:hypothetical protein